MGIFKKSPPPHAVAVQTGLPASHPFLKLERYVPLSAPDYGLYRTMREAVPVLDAAVGKLTRLVGGFTTVCGDERAKAALDQFLHEVRVGAGGHGIETFVSAFLEQLLVNGTAVGEMVPMHPRSCPFRCRETKAPARRPVSSSGRPSGSLSSLLPVFT